MQSMYYKLGDKVVLKDVKHFEEYNGKEFEIVEIYLAYCYKVAASGFDPIWVTMDNFVREGE